MAVRARIGCKSGSELNAARRGRCDMPEVGRKAAATDTSAHQTQHVQPTQHTEQARQRAPVRGKIEVAPRAIATIAGRAVERPTAWWAWQRNTRGSSGWS